MIEFIKSLFTTPYYLYTVPQRFVVFVLSVGTIFAIYSICYIIAEIKKEIEESREKIKGDKN